MLTEVQDTEHAVGTWNVLTQEERKVVGLFFPLDKKIEDDDEEESGTEDESEMEISTPVTSMRPQAQMDSRTR